MTATTEHAPPMTDQATLLSHAAGYASSRTITLGLRHGLIETLAG